MTTSIHSKFILKAIKKSFSSTKRFLKFKKQFYSQNKLPQPTNADIRELYEKMITQKKIKRKTSFEKSMLSRNIRTQSGVAVVAVLTKPYACPGKCAFCPSEKNMPKSYLSNEPAVMRAIMNNFNPYKQIQTRLHALMLNGHSTDKIELIIMGGTFSYFPKQYQTWFIKECFRACNEYKLEKITNGNSSSSVHKKTTLYQEQKRNEKTKTRIIGLTLETRPDWIDKKEIFNFRRLGCTRVELGVQSTYDNILKKNNRGHLTQSTIDATKFLKDAGFKINYHMMPGLYGSSPTKDFKMFKELFNNPDYQPDMLKIYPTVVIKGTLLYRWWKQGKYKAMSNQAFENLVIKIKNEIIPPYTRIQRLVRDIPLPSIEAGPTISNLRQIIAPKINCQCIRCREIKNEYNSNNKLILNKINYKASDGQEIFLQFIDDTYNLYALLRLRICSNNTAIIREIHTYGKLTPIGTLNKNSPQHIGLGKKLLKEAEQITKKEFGLNKITVISGIGVRNYYRKNGYRLQNTYMIKKL